MVKYDASVIQSFAEGLYVRAKRVIIISAALGVLIGFGLGAALAEGAGSSLLVVGGIAAALGGMIGYSAGQGRAFRYRLMAQQALCQVQIEKNTMEAVAVERLLAGQV